MMKIIDYLVNFYMDLGLKIWAPFEKHYMKGLSIDDKLNLDAGLVVGMMFGAHLKTLAIMIPIIVLIDITYGILYSFYREGLKSIKQYAWEPAEYGYRASGAIIGGLLVNLVNLFY